MDSLGIISFDSKPAAPFFFEKQELPRAGLRDALLAQVLYNLETVPAARALYRHLALNPEMPFEELVSTVPGIVRSFVRDQDPLSWLPHRHDRPLPQYLHRATGGTTSRALSIFYSEDDWRAALLLHVETFAARLRGVGPIVAFSTYNQSHISGPIFSGAIAAMGGLCINRSYLADDERTLEEIRAHRCNVIIAPAGKTTKGGTIESLLNLDSAKRDPYIHGGNIKAVIVSSSVLSSELLAELNSLGITEIINCYGSTEVMPVAFSCPKNPLIFHLVRRFVYGVVVDNEQRLCEHGERGIVLVGRASGLDRYGHSVRSTSTALLHYANGDGATVLTERCSCGYHGDSLTDIERITDIEEKLKSGCQAW